VGDIAVVDVDNDYQDDVIYFGVYGRTNAGKVWGNFYRLSLRSGTGYKSVSALTSSDICTAIDLGTFAPPGATLHLSLAHLTLQRTKTASCGYSSERVGISWTAPIRLYLTITTS